MRLTYSYLILFFLLLLSTSMLGQKTINVIGSVVDSFGHSPMVSATVVLYNLPDSSIADYNLLSENGKFELKGKKDSSYLLQISFIGFKPYISELALTEHIDLGTIYLEEQLLELDGPVIVSADRIPVQMRGDTLSFNSAAFHVQAHDDVEALLKQLPGVEIQEDGTISINGKVVTEILVDGKEFFGANAQAVLKSLPADAIKTIEIANTKKTKEGLDPNNDEKTIDLKLKEAAKKGWLGNLDGGYGYNVLPGPTDNHRYRGSFAINYFNDKSRVTFFGGINNINKAALSFEQRNVYGNRMIQSGVTRAGSAGFNLNWFFNENTDLNFSYMYNNNNRLVEHSSLRESILPENLYTRNSNDSSINYTQQHRVYARLWHKMPKDQKLRFIFRMNYNKGNNQQTRGEETLGAGDTLQNRISQQYLRTNDDWNIAPNIYYQKKFKKKGRELSTRAAFTFVFNSNFFDNNSFTNLYNDSGTLTQIDTLWQEQRGTRDEFAYNVHFNWREPLGEDNSLDFELWAGGRNSTNWRSTVDVVSQERIENSLLSDSYQKFMDYQEFKTTFKRKTDKYHFRARLGLRRTGLRGLIASDSTQIVQDFYYPTGYMRFRYFFSKSKKIIFTYNTRFVEPKVEQLQPLINNQNPLSLSIGNPNLQPEYIHSLNLRTDLYEQSNFTNFYAAIYINFHQNTIVQSQTLDADFRTTYQPINSDLSYRGGSYLGLNTAIKKLIKVDFRGGVVIYQSAIMNNDVLSNQFNHDYNAKLTISNKKKAVVDASISAKVVVGNSIYESNEALNVTYVNHFYSADFRVTIAQKLNIKTQFDYRVYDNAGSGESIAIPIWSAGLNYTFLKSNALKVELSAENLLNESFQVNRYSRDGIISESQSNLLGRYFMLSVTYQLRTGSKAK